MATRTNTTVTLNDIVPLDILTAMYEEGDNPREDNPVNITSIALAMNLSDADTFSLLDTIADLTDIVNGKGFDWWFTANYESADAMSDAYNDAMQTHGRKGKPVAKKTPAKPVKPAQSPLKGSDGKNVTVPVSEGSEERRELDAAQGEKILAEGALANLIKVSVPTAYEGKEYESDIVKHGLALEEPEFIPAMTSAAIAAGVSNNEWFMMYASLTQTARDWWTKRVSAKIEEYDTAENSVEPASKDEAGF